MNEIEEYRRLTDVYSQLPDDELLRLNAEVETLTETAQSVLRTEISLRHLPTEFAVKKQEVPGLEDVSSELGHFALLSSIDCVWEFHETDDAMAAAEMLRAEGIQFDLVLPSNEKFDMGAPRLAVVPDYVERARMLLSKPIPEEFRQLVRTQNQFVIPSCPGCGSPDPLLDSVEPTNEWRCEVCNKVWRSPLS